MKTENALTTPYRQWLGFSALLAALSVMIGAFAAHGLKNTLSAQALGWIDTGVQYQQMHAVAMLAVSIGYAVWQRSVFKWALISFTIGIALFSGSLYILAATDIRALGMVTPIGGLAFLSGWICLLKAAWSEK